MCMIPPTLHIERLSLMTAENVRSLARARRPGAVGDFQPEIYDALGVWHHPGKVAA